MTILKHLNWLKNILKRKMLNKFFTGFCDMNSGKIKVNNY